MIDRMTPTRRNLALTVVLALVLWFAWTVRSALNPILVALLFAYMLHPMVISLERRGWSRQRAVNVIFGGTAVGALLATLMLVAQGRQLWNDLAREDGLLQRLELALSSATNESEALLAKWMPEGGFFGEDEAPEAGTEPDPEGLDDADSAALATDSSAAVETPPLHVDLIAELGSWLQSERGINAAREAGTVAYSFVRRIFGSLLTFLTLAFLVPVYTWFLLFELERISSWLRGYVPVHQRERMASIGEQIAEVLGSFFRGRVLVCLLKGLMLWILLVVLGVPYAFLIGILSGFLSLIPFVGPFFGYGMVFIVYLAMGGEGEGEFSLMGAVWRTALVATIGEMVEGYVLIPRVLGDTLGLHPLAVLISLTVAGAALGMFGLLLALPLTAAVIIVARELVLPAAKDWAEGRRGRGAPPAVT